MSPLTTTEIAAYEVNVVSSGEPHQFAATVWLFKADGGVFAFLRFYRPGVSMAANGFRQDLGIAEVSFRLDALAPLVDVLRNEKPLYFQWFDYPPRLFGAVGTSREPVGEQEQLG